MTKKHEILIFITALAIIAITFAGGLLYLKTQAKLIADTVPVAGTTTSTSSSAADGAPSAPALPALPLPPTSTTPVAATSSPATPSLVLPYQLSAANENVWTGYWGSFSASGGVLTLAASSTTSGGDAFLDLDGTSAWKNYAVSAQVNWIANGWFDIAARTANDTQNFVYCEFGSNRMALIERVDGSDTALALSASSGGAATGTSQTYGMTVYGNDVACTLNGKQVLGVAVPQNEAASGGVGFITWGEAGEHSEIAVSDVSVSPLSKETMQIPFVPPVSAPAAPVAPASGSTNPASTSTASTSSTTPASVPTANSTPTSSPITLPFLETNFTGDANWQSVWGDFVVDSSGTLDMPATDGNTGGSVLLQNSSALTDYKFESNFDWLTGDTVGLIARYTNSKNYVLCEFDGSTPGSVNIYLEQYINGQEYTLANGVALGDPGIGDLGADAWIEVQSTQGICSFNNHVVSEAGQGTTINPPFSGNIGFTMWDPTKNKSHIVVHSVNLQELN